MKNPKKRFIPRQVLSSGIKLFLLLALAIFCFPFPGTASGGTGSKFAGVQVGTITYSYRSMPDQSLKAILGYIVQSGLSSVELMGPAIEQYAGIPQTKDPQVLRQWRTNVSMDKFKEIRKMFKAKGVKIDILKLGSHSWSDEEIDCLMFVRFWGRGYYHGGFRRSG